MIDRIRTFVGKARHRGPNYVRDIFSYHAHAARYRLIALSGRTSAGATTGFTPHPTFHFAPETVPAIVASVPDFLRREVIADAQRILEHRFSFRGLPEVRLSKAIDWNLVPEKNLSWSWDLNRHLFFLTLGTAYHYTGDARYKNKLLSLWQDWMLANPPGKGHNWRSPFEVAARLRNWMWAYFLVDASSNVSPLFLRKARRGLAQHAAFLADHLEFHWPNNHLLLEALSLCEFAVVFQGQGGERYLPLASRVLEEQVRRQVLRDGVHSELCPMYHNIVASELGAFTLLCRKSGHPLPLSLEERIFSMKRFSDALRRCDGSTPLLGDSSFPDTCFRFDPCPQSGSDLIYWLNNGPPTGRAPAQRELSLDLFSEGGYGILRNVAHQTHLTLDFGSFSRCPTANHGHSDALSFELYAEGRPWIVDSGFFHLWNDNDSRAEMNNSALEWSRYFRSAAAHNSLLVDGKEHNGPSEHNDIGDPASTRLAGYSSNPDEVAVTAEVEPFWSHGDAIHQRRVSLTKSGEVAVTDHITGTQSRRLQWVLHFASDLEVELSGAATVVARAKDAVLVCELRSSGRAPRLRLVRGQTSPLQGWVAQSSAQVVPAWVLIAEVEVSLPYDLDFRIAIRSRTVVSPGTEGSCSEAASTPMEPVWEFAGVRS